VVQGVEPSGSSELRALSQLAPCKENASLAIDRRQRREGKRDGYYEITIKGLRDRLVYDSKDGKRAERFD